MKTKVVTFEGAGWEEAESSKAADVGNCRVRGTFLNKRGQAIYLEVLGLLPHSHSPGYIKPYKVAGVISHCFEINNKDTSNLRRLEGTTFEYSKKSLLTLINSLEIGGDFEEIVVDSNWDGFNLDGVTKHG